MDPTSRADQDDDEEEISIMFFDSADEFPFYDCADSFSDESEPSTSSSDREPSPEYSTPAVTLQRRPSPLRKFSDKESDNPRFGSPTVSDLGSVSDGTRSFSDKRCELYPSSQLNAEESESTQGVESDHEDEDHSTATTANEVTGRDSVDSVSEPDDSSFSLLMFLARLVIKAVGFQINVFIAFLTFPIWGFYSLYMFVIDPFRTIRRCRQFFIGNIVRFIDLVCGLISPLVNEWFKDHKDFLKVAMRYGWGLLWALYVCFMLCSLLASSLVISGVLMRYLVEEPIQMKEVLNFDFTKLRPVAYVPVISCADDGCGVDCEEKMEAQRQAQFRVIPTNHRLQVTVSLTVPESEYNRNLGIFQVRVDLLSVKGETLASASHPCMLQFKSEPLRLLLTFLKLAPLITGYGSESQTLNLKFKGFTEGDVPTSCLKVVIEQRAEYRPGAGIPEMYDASVALESELPLFKRLLWNWKKTIFVWVAMISFTMELLCTLLCCRPIIMPRMRRRVLSVRNSANRPSLRPRT